jgi:hypothetical protein
MCNLYLANPAFASKLLVSAGTIPALTNVLEASASNDTISAAACCLQNLASASDSNRRQVAPRRAAPWGVRAAPSLRTTWTRLVHPSVLIGHVHAGGMKQVQHASCTCFILSKGQISQPLTARPRRQVVEAGALRPLARRLAQPARCLVAASRTARLLGNLAVLEGNEAPLKDSGALDALVGLAGVGGPSEWELSPEQQARPRPACPACPAMRARPAGARARCGGG